MSGTGPLQSHLLGLQYTFMLPIEKQRLTQNIRQQCARGYQLYDAGDFQGALRLFYQAWLTLPKPQTDWAEAGWVLTAIGDTYFRLERYRPGCEALSSALCCPNMDQAPFAYLRLGQCLWELGGEEEARTALHEAYKLAQLDIFKGEDDKYQLAISDLMAEAPAPEASDPATQSPTNPSPISQSPINQSPESTEDPL
ncbi:tol-pal system YbgF family protein [Marinimicrobium sp. ABcell2]|uniref:tetratricopeptide repeat protein n=1 Tax=Marinimicrobium sp. ABcell2 TaxID=3069751 RepID=UPI0027B521D8|nr:hypothetical protein [Marinimicrobium sp. ABcell2]MDQ2078021.1 hypothetical protein [Marinimicrobium sp. ABcell2]